MASCMTQLLAKQPEIRPPHPGRFLFRKPWATTPVTPPPPSHVQIPTSYATDWPVMSDPVKPRQPTLRS